MGYYYSDENDFNLECSSVTLTASDNSQNIFIHSISLSMYVAVKLHVVSESGWSRPFNHRMEMIAVTFSGFVPPNR